MSVWTEFSSETVWALLPTDVRAFYTQWITNYPEKEGRLEELVLETAQLFRQAAASNPENVIDPDERMVPVTGFRHAVNTLLYNLMMEAGAELVPEVYTLTTRADIWLRQVQRGVVVIETAVEEAPLVYAGSPSYGEAVLAERSLA
jgi:hypothetical protein